MDILFRYLSLVVKVVTSVLLWAGLMVSVAKAGDRSSTLSHVSDSLWTMGVDKPNVDRAMSDEESEEDSSLEAKKELPEELVRALKHL
ncbi:MAG: hypothetical protein COW00_17180 [Bdellovibrio sp. CG12_big_fil_rev_8_21_14_0_65_39_13]|nr:MAG: hypothetical protein COW78_00350 [Bdellovibrio sp. CG22_combo_CG10-13_8_21_14_all_39_27]PIQ58168.1 MAG: hypothetical protein COW00_17180 [Bdellovibrio sp. CG12_big_fil_rev_8_21_14_0_65_39_13]PIR34330.1 MAG: hypothetical protein COV37_13420 [Bdellovibrio sp. CG11_big_fil_rev_8_21_14_0_20_39_38]PJB52229.1 MAG: hypothetical protein CO099_13725 [Bdellovibrio sp. CG_4_9_14_3_um_filter_39_7]